MTITAKGYRRVYDAASKRRRMEHDVVWERARGPIPPGFVVHHVNYNKLNNRIENLELLDPLTHKRLHGGCESPWRHVVEAVPQVWIDEADHRVLPEQVLGSVLVQDVPDCELDTEQA